MKSLTYKHYYKTFNEAFYIYKSALLTFSEQQDVTERGLKILFERDEAE